MMHTTETLKAPFPYFGGKSRCASLVWERFGDVTNFVEPFFGSGAVLLARPDGHTGSTETVNDVDAYVANFWRAIQADPEAVAAAADYPVNECDLHARHAWLHGQAERVERLKCDPDYFDPRVAGYWAWGLSSWIGDGFCRPKGDKRDGRDWKQTPHLRNPGMGVNRKLPHLGDPGKGECAERWARLMAYFQQIADRMRRVRVCCGDWTRVLTPSVTFRHGVTGVFLDPPYDVVGTGYGVSSKGVSGAVRAWCAANGDNPDLRIALCGYVDEAHGDYLPGWECVAWKSGGGYNNLGNGKNRGRERIWFSPHCLGVELDFTS